jgi:hypothetical protein
MLQHIIIYRVFTTKKIVACELVESDNKPVRHARNVVHGYVRDLNVPMIYSIFNTAMIEVFHSSELPQNYEFADNTEGN